MLRYLVFSLLIGVSAFGQNAVVAGRISDSQDAVIAGASIAKMVRPTLRTVSPPAGQAPLRQVRVRVRYREVSPGVRREIRVGEVL